MDIKCDVMGNLLDRFDLSNESSLCESIGFATIRPRCKHTTIWPSILLTLDGPVDLEKEYRLAIEGQIVEVMSISEDKESYLVLANSKTRGYFLWCIDAKDVFNFTKMSKRKISLALSLIEQSNLYNNTQHETSKTQ